VVVAFVCHTSPVNCDSAADSAMVVPQPACAKEARGIVTCVHDVVAVKL
jgi:hypothetical protein